MLTITKFVGAILHGLTNSRTISDATSAKISERYLNHDYLRAFPVPRMTLKNVEVDLNFSVGSITTLETILKEPEVRKNIAHRFGELLSDLPGTDAFKAEFGSETVSASAWRAGISELMETIQRILSGTISDKDTLIHTLSLAVENFFYQMHHTQSEHGLISGLRKIFERTVSGSTAPKDAGTIRSWATQQASLILDAAVPGGISVIEDLPELSILVGASELEGQKTENLQKAKLSFTSEDRKWVSVEKNGEKNYILDRG